MLPCTKFLLSEIVYLVDRVTFQTKVDHDSPNFCDSISIFFNADRHKMCPVFWKLSLFLILSNHVHGAVIFGIRVAHLRSPFLAFCELIRLMYGVKEKQLLTLALAATTLYFISHLLKLSFSLLISSP